MMQYTHKTFTAQYLAVYFQSSDR